MEKLRWPNSSAELGRQAPFRLQAGGRPNFSFNEFERRISASGTFSASGWGPTEFQLQRIRAPNFGVRHIFGFRLGADRISASANSSAEFRLQAGGRANFSFNEFERRISASGTFSASGWGPSEFPLQRIRAPNFGVRHIFGFRLGADRISASANSIAEFRRQAPFRLKAEFRLQRRILASGPFSASVACRIEYRRRIRASADFRLQPAPTEFRRRISASEFKLQGGYETGTHFPGSLYALWVMVSLTLGSKHQGLKAPTRAP